MIDNKGRDAREALTQIIQAPLHRQEYRYIEKKDDDIGSDLK